LVWCVHASVFNVVKGCSDWHSMSRKSSRILYGHRGGTLVDWFGSGDAALGFPIMVFIFWYLSISPCSTVISFRCGRFRPRCLFSGVSEAIDV
jgi:hypothetical protein